MAIKQHLSKWASMSKLILNMFEFSVNDFGTRQVKWKIELKIQLLIITHVKGQFVYISFLSHYFPPEVNNKFTQMCKHVIDDSLCSEINFLSCYMLLRFLYFIQNESFSQQVWTSDQYLILSTWFLSVASTFGIDLFVYLRFLNLDVFWIMDTYWWRRSRLHIVGHCL